MPCSVTPFARGELGDDTGVRGVEPAAESGAPRAHQERDARRRLAQPLGARAEPPLGFLATCDYAVESGGGGDSAPGAARSAHRAPEPDAAERPARADDRAAPSASERDVRAALRRPRPLQGGQRHARPPRSATALLVRLGERLVATSLRDATRSRASAATSSGCCSRRSARGGGRSALARGDHRGDEAADRGRGDCSSASPPASAWPCTPSTGRPPTDLMKHADVAMYEAKDALGQEDYALPESSDAHSAERLDADRRRSAAPSPTASWSCTTSPRSACATAARRRRGARAVEPPGARAAPAGRLRAAGRAVRRRSDRSPPRAARASIEQVRRGAEQGHDARPRGEHLRRAPCTTRT